MKKNDKQTLNRRLLAIYVCYFIIIGAGFLHSFLPVFASGFSAGINAAQQEMELARQGIEKRWYIFSVRPDILGQLAMHPDTSSDHVAMEMDTYEALVSVTVSSADPDNDPTLQFIAGSYRKTMALSMCASLSWLAILVLIGVIINSLRRSIRDQRTLPDSNILYMRIIGCLIIVSELLGAWSICIGQQTVDALVDGGVAFAGAFPVEYGKIMLGVLVLFSAEMFAIGTALSEEQKLTI